MNLTVNFIPDTAKCATHKLLTPTSVTVHWIGPYPGQTPEQVRDWWIKSNGEASAHFIIKDEQVLQCWPLYKAAWHAGCKSGNYGSIGIEVVPSNVEGEFSEKSIATLKELIDKLDADCCMKLPVLRHYDWVGKDCPKYYVDNEKWKELLVHLGRL